MSGEANPHQILPVELQVLVYWVQLSTGVAVTLRPFRSLVK